MIIMIRADGNAVDAILRAVRPLVAEDRIEFFAPAVMPGLADEEKKIESLAQEIANAIRPTAKQPMRPEALRVALKGWDTFWDQKGEADPALRNALGALSKAMRPIFPYDASPIDRLATRTKKFDDKTGHYLGTVYRPTALGNRVREILEAEGSL